jgi:hypothetical protein
MKCSFLTCIHYHNSEFIPLLLLTSPLRGTESKHAPKSIVALKAEEVAECRRKSGMTLKPLMESEREISIRRNLRINSRITEENSE